MPKFETFYGKKRPPTTEPVMSIQKRAMIAMNAAAVTLLTGEQDPDEVHVEFLFDPKEKIVAVKLSKPDTPHSYLLQRPGERSTTRVVSAKAFTTHYGIPVGDSSTKYNARGYGEGVVGFSLVEDEI